MDYLELLGIDLPTSDPGEEGEFEQHSDEEEEEDDEEEDADVEEQQPGTTTLRQILYGNGDEATTVVENVDDVAVVNARESDDVQIMENDVVKVCDDNREENKSVEWNMGEIDGSFCPICFDAWSDGGDHHVCCLPCGHIYGLSCIKKWLRRRGSSKCPQCKKKCAMKDIRLLYASRIVAIDGELQKKVQSLEAKCASLEKKNAELSKKEVQLKNVEADLCKQMRHLNERTRNLENLLVDMERRAPSGSTASSWYIPEPAWGLGVTSKSDMPGCSNNFILQKEFQVDGARLFDIDSSSKIFVIARRLSGLGGMHVLTKMSMLHNHEKEDIKLPLNTKAVKDLQVSPHARLVLLASLGKKLSILSTESNNTILTYDLPAAPWSCSWDICSSHYVYAGLQNGALLQFDLRHTMGPVESLTGLTENPIHTVESLATDPSLSSGFRSVLTASSLGLCQWNFGSSEQRPHLIPESNKHGVCISLAYCPTRDDIVASYRPKIEISGGLEVTQPTLAAFASQASGQGVQGTNVHFKRTGCRYQKLGATCANVSDIRLPKSAIIEGVSRNAVFASADEVTCELVLQELPSLMVVDHLKVQKHPIRDFKYSRVLSSGLLSCLSGDFLQLFSQNLQKSYV
ncbi:hypothetical protein ACJIZ3_021889 [Penstemon smallii]|uniref:RING-type E3 ubiquitin transferase n=1 Tax=Penstemon smallii TaxID=265156 RepID=A0ABD3SMQ9_9LAMI